MHTLEFVFAEVDGRRWVYHIGCEEIHHCGECWGSNYRYVVNWWATTYCTGVLGPSPLHGSDVHKALGRRTPDDNVIPHRHVKFARHGFLSYILKAAQLQNYQNAFSKTALAKYKREEIGSNSLLCPCQTCVLRIKRLPSLHTC